MSMRMTSAAMGILVMAAMVSVTQAADQQPSPTPAASGRLEYRGFAVDVTPLKTRADRERLLQALRRQFDMVADVTVDQPTHEFFRTIPIVVDSVLTADLAYGGSAASYTKKFAFPPRPGPLGVITIVVREYDRDAPIFLHEFLHAYHDQRLPEHSDNPEILRLFKEARETHTFPDDAYMMSKVGEYFAMAGTVYLHGSALRDPFTRENLKNRQPALHQWFVKEFGPK